MNALRYAALAGIVGLACAAPATAQTDFEWRGQMAAGQGIEIKGINGSRRAVRSGPACRRGHTLRGLPGCPGPAAERM